VKCTESSSLTSLSQVPVSRLVFRLTHVILCHVASLTILKDYEWDISHGETVSSLDSTVKDFDDFKQYSQEVLPGVVKSRLEVILAQRLQPFREELLSALGDIVQSSQAAVFEDWQRKRRRVSPSELHDSTQNVSELLPIPHEPFEDLQTHDLSFGNVESGDIDFSSDDFVDIPTENTHGEFLEQVNSTDDTPPQHLQPYSEPSAHVQGLALKEPYFVDFTAIDPYEIGVKNDLFVQKS
jgi:hypothetical protein